MFECKGCTKRHPGCHSECESYLAEKKRLQAQKDAHESERNFNAYQISHAQRLYRKKKNRRKF